MAQTDASVALRALELLGLSETELPRIVALLPNARRRLALEHSGEAFRKDFAVTVTSGAVDLTGATFLAAAEPVLLESLRTADIRSSSYSYKWQWVGNRSVLSLQPTPLDFPHYTVEGATLYTNAADAAATMRAKFEPSLTTIEARGEDDALVELVAMMIAGVPTKEEAA